MPLPRPSRRSAARRWQVGELQPGRVPNKRLPAASSASLPDLPPVVGWAVPPETVHDRLALVNYGADDLCAFGREGPGAGRPRIGRDRVLLTRDPDIVAKADRVVIATTAPSPSASAAS